MDNTGIIRVNKVYQPLLYNTRRYLVLMGGAGSGKSVFGTQKIAIRLTTEPGHRFLMVRKVARFVKETIFKEFKARFNEMGIMDEFIINESEKTFTHIPTGNEIISAGLDDVEKLKSIHGITGIIIEEATEVSEEDFDQLDLRLRGETPNYKQIIIMFNPIDEKHWLKKRFFDSADSDCTTLITTVDHNRYIDEEYRQILEKKASINPNFYRIYRLAQWGKREVERPYANNFNYDIHVSSDAERDPDKDLFFIFDFNVDPFVCLCAHAWSDGDGHHVHFFEEIVLFDGSVPKMIEKIKSMFTEVELSRVIVTGDAMQRKREITQVDNRDAWMMLCDQLGITPKRFRVPTHNPKVRDNRVLLNFILYQHKDFKFNPKMTLTINEMLYTEADADGNILKKNRDNEDQRADALDCVRYFCNSFMSDFIKNHKYY